MLYRDKFLQIFALSFFGGVFIRSFLDVSWPFSSFLFVLATFFSLIAFLSIRFFNFDKNYLRKSVLFSVFLLGIGFGIFRLDYYFSSTAPKYLNKFFQKTITFKALVIDEVDRRPAHDVVTVEAQELLNFGDTKNVGEKIIVFTNKFPEINYGDLLEVEGKLEEPKSFENDNGKEFDYKAYLAKDDIYYEIFYPKINILYNDKGNLLKGLLLNIKQKFVQSVESMIPEPESGLLSGLLLGSKKALSDEWISKFRSSGLVHMVVLSGYNITIVADSIIKSLSFLPPIFSNLGAILGILAFALMTGATPTTVRASIMALIAILSRNTGRIYLAGRALVIAGFVMVMNNPKILAFDFSFQLSFLATVAIIYLSPKIKNKLGFVTEKWGLREIISSTLATQIFVAPLLLYRSGQLSIFSLPANILVLSFIPSTMFFGFITGVLAFVSKILAWPFSLVAYILLKYEMFIANLFSSLPFSNITIESFSKTLLIFCYLVLLYLTFFLKEGTRASKA